MITICATPTIITIYCTPFRYNGERHRKPMGLSTSPAGGSIGEDKDGSSGSWPRYTAWNILSGIWLEPGGPKPLKSIAQGNDKAARLPPATVIVLNNNGVGYLEESFRPFEALN